MEQFGDRKRNGRPQAITAEGIFIHTTANRDPRLTVLDIIQQILQLLLCTVQKTIIECSSKWAHCGKKTCLQTKKTALSKVKSKLDYTQDEYETLIGTVESKFQILRSRCRIFVRRRSRGLKSQACLYSALKHGARNVRVWRYFDSIIA